jgi:acetyltransferase-like isoleucine patch superfamily enzyme
MKSLLVAGPDLSLRDVHALALEVEGARRHVAMLHIPSTDYYNFDLSDLARFSPAEWDVAIAVNEFYINDVRRALHEEMAARGYKAVSLVSPRAHVSADAVMGENSIIHAGCFVGAGSTLGHHCVLRPNVVLAEEVCLGNYVTLEANVSIREKSTVGDFVTICANSSLARMTVVGKHSYLNLPRQFTGNIAPGTFLSPMFENPVRVLPVAPAPAS